MAGSAGDESGPTPPHWRRVGLIVAKRTNRSGQMRRLVWSARRETGRVAAGDKSLIFLFLKNTTHAMVFSWADRPIPTLSGLGGAAQLFRGRKIWKKHNSRLEAI